MSEFYHVCTNGLARNLWFYDEGDYLSGMNSVPVCAMTCGITVLCFTLMSNHVHFVVKGNEADCTKFIWEYKRLRSRQLTIRYGGRRTIADARAYVGRIPTMEKLKNVIAYVMRNPIGAGLRLMPSEYRWGSSGLYFADTELWNLRYDRLGDIPVRRKRKVFKTRTELPEDFLVDGGKMIFPGSYIDYRTVESIFRTPRQLLYHLSSANDMEAELETGVLAKVGHGDTELAASSEQVSSEMFSGRSPRQLTIEELYTLARSLKKRYGASPKQLARVLSLDYNALKSML